MKSVILFSLPIVCQDDKSLSMCQDRKCLRSYKRQWYLNYSKSLYFQWLLMNKGKGLRRQIMIILLALTNDFAPKGKRRTYIHSHSNNDWVEIENAKSLRKCFSQMMLVIVAWELPTFIASAFRFLLRSFSRFNGRLL